MNFPESQRTGALGELDVIRLFTDWQWSVGRYLIDSGYDLYVTPDHGKYLGISLYVQVKGTAKSSGKRVTALVSRSRLRTYAEAMLPVFIVRATADGRLFWTDAQEWARTNNDQLEGPGSATVAFSTDRRLSDREGFESYLARLLPTVQERVAAVAEFSERSRYLNSFDSRLGIRLIKGDQSTEHHLFAKDHSFEAQFSFKPLRSPDNLKSLREAIELGLPRAVEIESVNMTGSPVFEEIGANRFEKGDTHHRGARTEPRSGSFEMSVTSATKNLSSSYATARTQAAQAAREQKEALLFARRNSYTIVVGPETSRFFTSVLLSRRTLTCSMMALKRGCRSGLRDGPVASEMPLVDGEHVPTTQFGEPRWGSRLPSDRNTAIQPEASGLMT